MSYARQLPPQTRNPYGRGSTHSAPTRGRGGHGRPLNTTGPTTPVSEPDRQKAEVEEDVHPGLRMEQEHGAVGHQRPSATEERSFQSRGAYYSLPPKQGKHEELQRSIRREEQAIEAHRELKREKNRQKLDSYVPQTLGGPEMSLADRRAQAAEKERLMRLEERGKRVQFKEKREEYQRAQREKENREIEEKKRVAREQAIQLEKKKKSQEAGEAEQVAGRLEEMRRARLQRFGNA